MNCIAKRPPLVYGATDYLGVPAEKWGRFERKPSPHDSFTVRACDFVVSTGPTRLRLVLQRPGEKIPQKEGGPYVRVKQWKLPGGRHEFWEPTIQDTYYRELGQETGLKYTPVEFSCQLMHVFSGGASKRHSEGQHWDIYCPVATLSERCPSELPMDDAEILGVKEFPLVEIPTFIDEGVTLAVTHLRRIRHLLHRNQDWRKFLCDRGVTLGEMDAFTKSASKVIPGLYGR